MLDSAESLSMNNSQQVIRQIIDNMIRSESDDMNVEQNDEERETRSASPSSQNEMLQNENDDQILKDDDQEEEEAKMVMINGDLATEMSRQLQFIVRLLESFGQHPCTCTVCDKQLNKNRPDVHYSSETLNGAQKENSEQSEAAIPSTTPFGSSNLNLEAVNQMFKQLSNGTTSHSFPPSVELNESGTLKRGRKSKYCSNEEKRAVAEYAEIHGATAAARKFEIPASVAAYYHRKLKKARESTGLPPASVSSTLPSGQSPQFGHQEIRQKTSNDLDLGVLSNSDDAENQQSANNGQANAQFGIFNMKTESGENCGRSPASGTVFLRGRGRGRPKLIGDELDYNLVEHMVDIKSRLPGKHLTASHALEIARAYIMEKSPHILSENGGRIHLKPTWAMKLVNRTNERYRELHGGSDSPNPDAYSFTQLSKHVENQNVDVGAAAEITNEKVLEFPFAPVSCESPQSNEMLDYDNAEFNSGDEQPAAVE
ncbi:hypothetical protein M3Y98_00295100 [Aphelenchoides besseyi]|nr:hypothetical protein M3Y98_00295100 [Aphelenchoides besseyi]